MTDRIPGAAGHARGGGPALLEREPVLDVLLGAVATAAAGHGCAAILTGEAGIGKTSMVRALRASLDHGVRVLAGACDDLLSPRALGPLREAAAGTTGPLAAAIAGSRNGETDAVPGAAVAELAAWRPTVLIVEDLHWADDATLDVLGYLGARLADLPAVLVLTYRDDEAPTAHPVHRLLGALAGGRRRLRAATRRSARPPWSGSRPASAGTRTGCTRSPAATRSTSPRRSPRRGARRAGLGVRRRARPGGQARRRRAAPRSSSCRWCPRSSGWTWRTPCSATRLDALAEAEERGIVTSRADGLDVPPRAGPPGRRAEPVRRCAGARCTARWSPRCRPRPRPRPRPTGAPRRAGRRRRDASAATPRSPGGRPPRRARTARRSPTSRPRCATPTGWPTPSWPGSSTSTPGSSTTRAGSPRRCAAASGRCGCAGAACAEGPGATGDAPGGARAAVAAPVHGGRPRRRRRRGRGGRRPARRAARRLRRRAGRSPRPTSARSARSPAIPAPTGGRADGVPAPAPGAGARDVGGPRATSWRSAATTRASPAPTSTTTPASRCCGTACARAGERLPRGRGARLHQPRRAVLPAAPARRAGALRRRRPGVHPGARLLLARPQPRGARRPARAAPRRTGRRRRSGLRRDVDGEPSPGCRNAAGPYGRLLARRRGRSGGRRSWLASARGSAALRRRTVTELALAGAALAEWAWLADRPDRLEVAGGWCAADGRAGTAGRARRRAPRGPRCCATPRRAGVPGERAVRPRPAPGRGPPGCAATGAPPPRAGPALATRTSGRWSWPSRARSGRPSRLCTPWRTSGRPPRRTTSGEAARARDDARAAAPARTRGPTRPGSPTASSTSTRCSPRG